MRMLKLEPYEVDKGIRVFDPPYQNYDFLKKTKLNYLIHKSHIILPNFQFSCVTI